MLISTLFQLRDIVDTPEPYVHRYPRLMPQLDQDGVNLPLPATSLPKSKGRFRIKHNYSQSLNWTSITYLESFAHDLKFELHYFEQNILY